MYEANIRYRHTNTFNSNNYLRNHDTVHTAGKTRRISPFQRDLYRFLRNKTALTVVGVLLILLGVAILLFGQNSNTSDAEASTIKVKQYTSIEVHHGDTLWSLAGEYGEPYKDRSVFIDEVKELNKLHGDFISEGGYLYIPIYK